MQTQPEGTFTLGEFYSRDDIARMVELIPESNNAEVWLDKLRKEFVEPKMDQWLRTLTGPREEITPQYVAAFVGAQIIRWFVRDVMPAMIAARLAAMADDEEIPPRSKMN